MTNQVPPSGSPTWGSTTKLVVGLTFVAIIAALLVQFRQIIGPLILAFMLAFLLHPVANQLSTTSRIPWRTSVSLVYLLLVIILVVLFIIAGLAIVQQIESLVNFVQRFVTQIPTLITDFSTRVYVFGPFQFDFSQFDLSALTDQLLGVLQSLLGEAGGLVSRFATSAVVTLGWLVFVLVVSYFLLTDAGRVPESLVQVEIPGYDTDIRRLGSELMNIWNAFLRGQLILSLLVIVSYSILLTILGTRFTLAIALMAGAARFVPYIGPFTTWTVTALVAFLQPSNYFGLDPFRYALLVVIACLVVDQIFDNLIVPRLLGHTLGVHPAAVLVAAIIATNLLGIIGLVLAAPVLATLNLMGRYILRKMFDLDPWPEAEKVKEKRARDIILPWIRTGRRMRDWWRTIARRFR